MEIKRQILITVIVSCLLNNALFQTVFEAGDLEWKSFSGCCGNKTGCQPVGQPNYYRHLSISNDSESLWVGAMNFLFKLNIQSLECKAHKFLPVSERKTIRCTVQGKSETPDCQNHIRTVIELNDQDMYVCGTGAYSPVNYTFNYPGYLDEFDIISSTWSSSQINVNFRPEACPDRQAVIETANRPGAASCPYDPLDNNTAIKIDQGNPWNSSALYFGTYSDFNKNFPVFFRPEYNLDGKTYLRKTTDSEDNNWLYAPQFVGSFDEEDSVFFFFREMAIETPSDDRKIYSRVGKVCKKDQGGGLLEIARTKWLSFQKARLNCSLPGNLPFYFDDVYDVYKQGDYYYALFYKQAGFLSASAICIYKKSDILKVFRGKFQYRNSYDNWETLATDPVPRLDNCSLYENDVSNEDIRSRYQLMDSSVQPVYGQPIFYQQGVQLLKIVVGETSQSARNIYVASDEGKIYDIFFKEGPTNSFEETIVKLNKIYAPFTSTARSYAVWNMKLLDSAVLLGTDYNVTRLNLDVCTSIKNVDTCILDTQCVWNNCNKKCTSRSNSQRNTCTDIMSHVDITHEKPMVELLLDKNVIKMVERTQRDGIVGIYTKLDILHKVSRKLTRWKRALPDQPLEDLDMERDAAKYALSWNGDLTIANTTIEDEGNYKAYDQDDFLIADYQLNIKENNDEIIDAWKQQFSDWSMAFTRWKACSHDYFQGCVKQP